MSINQFFGVVSLTVGIMLLGFGIYATQAVTEQVVEAVSGKYTDHTMLYIVGGVALIAGGIALLLNSRAKS